MSGMMVDYHGRSVTLRELAQLTGLKYSTLKRRAHSYGDTGERLWRPIDPSTGGRNGGRKPKVPKTVDYKGREVTFLELSQLTGIKYQTLMSRYYGGERGEKLWSNVDRSTGFHTWSAESFARRDATLRERREVIADQKRRIAEAAREKAAQKGRALAEREAMLNAPLFDDSILTAAERLSIRAEVRRGAKAQTLRFDIL